MSNAQSNLIIPSSPKDRQAIKNAVTEIGNSLTRIEAERDHIKDILARIEDNQEIPKKIMRKLAAAVHKQKVAEVQSEQDDFDALYETVGGANDEG